MNRVNTKRIFCLFLVIISGILGTRCAATKEELHAHGGMTSVKTYPKDYVHPLTEINLDKVINENRGLKVLVENATTVHDYYRGAVQEKAEGERLLNEGKWANCDVIAILVNTRRDIADALAAAKALETISKIVPSLKIDLDPLIEEGECIEARIKSMRSQVATVESPTRGDIYR